MGGPSGRRSEATLIVVFWIFVLFLLGMMASAIYALGGFKGLLVVAFLALVFFWLVVEVERRLP